MIELTERAQQKMRQYLDKSDCSIARVKLVKAGWRPEFALTLDKSVTDSDIVFQAGNLKVAVDRKHYDDSLMLTVDCLENPWAQGFIVKVRGSNCISWETTGNVKIIGAQII